jgi:hypothetical protein
MRRIGVYTALLCAALAGAASEPADAAQVVLQFRHPDPAAVDGYRVWLGTRSRSYGRRIDLGMPPSVGGWFVAPIQARDDERFVAVSAYNTAGESRLSNERALAAPPAGAGPAGPAPVFVFFDHLRFPFLAGFGFDGGPLGVGSLGGPAFAAGGRRPAPVWCELDGEEGQELVLGFGPGASAEIEIRVSSQQSFAPIARLAVGGAASVGEAAATVPACGDLDGDGLDEIVVGFGSGGGGRVRVLDDAVHGFAPIATRAGNGWIVAGSASLGDGSTAPAVGDVDGDGLAEIAVGFGPRGQGLVRVLDDARRAFAPRVAGAPDGWLRLGWAAYEQLDGRIRPALGDLDGDPAAELVLGLGSVAGAWLRVLDDGANGFQPLATSLGDDGWLGVPGAAREGESLPVVRNLDGDGVGELAVDLGAAADGAFATFDDGAGGAPIALLGVDRIPSSDLGETSLAR